VDAVDRKPSITVTLSSAGDEIQDSDEGVVVDEELLVNDTWMVLDDARREQVGKSVGSALLASSPTSETEFACPLCALLSCRPLNSSQISFFASTSKYTLFNFRPAGYCAISAIVIQI
jgi:hypothetical protein